MNRTDYLLVTLGEECSEVAKLTSKGVRFGLNECGPHETDNNRRCIEKELADVIAVAEMLGLKIQDDDKAAKVAKVEKYMEYSRKVGKLDDGVTTP